MELSCQLSPLAYHALYDTIVKQTDLRSVAVARVKQVGGSQDTLQSISRGYRALWEFQLDQTGGNPSELWPVDTSHARLATWVLAFLRHQLKRPSEDVSAWTRNTIAEEMQVRFGSLPSSDMFQPTVIAWTLGQVCGRLDVSLPAIPAIAVPDPDVALAYTGLIVHLLNLQGVVEPWPEVASSATLWRSAGIIDGLKAQPSFRIWPAIEEAMEQARDVIPPLIANLLSSHWTEFIKFRNGLTHVWKGSNEYAFHNLATRMGQWRDIELSIRAITYFVFSEISLGVLEDTDFAADRLLDGILRELSSYSDD
jgi:hypothetical protein